MIYIYNLILILDFLGLKWKHPADLYKNLYHEGKQTKN